MKRKVKSTPLKMTNWGLGDTSALEGEVLKLCEYMANWMFSEENDNLDAYFTRRFGKSKLPLEISIGTEEEPIQGGRIIFNLADLIDDLIEDMRNDCVTEKDYRPIIATLKQKVKMLETEFNKWETAK